jgi:AraC-like DNA-binding protein
MQASIMVASFGDSADADEVVFSKMSQNMPIVSADRYLDELLIRYCEEALIYRGVGRGSFRSSVENAIVPLLPHGRARAAEISRRLGMSERTLARRLASERLTFVGVLNQLRQDLAKRYLKETDLSVSRVAWLLGYQEVSGFTHAFKRWTGRTPNQARSKTAIGGQRRRKA